MYKILKVDPYLKEFEKDINLRMETYKSKRKELLKNNSVSKVCEMLGFSSIYAFSRAYKNFYGYSPKNTK